MQHWGLAANLYFGAEIDSAFCCPWDSKMNISFRDE